MLNGATERVRWREWVKFVSRMAERAREVKHLQVTISCFKYSSRTCIAPTIKKVTIESCSALELYSA